MSFRMPAYARCVDPTYTRGRSSIAADASFKCLEARIGAERLKPWPQEDARVESLTIGAVEPRHRLIQVSERRIDHRDFRCVRIAAPRVLQVAQHFEGFVCAAGSRVRTSKIR